MLRRRAPACHLLSRVLRQVANMSRPRLSADSRGLTLIEIIIVVLILAILASIAVSAALGARDRSAAKVCQSHLRHLQQAKEQWALENRKSPEDVPEMTDLVSKYLKYEPECPAAGDYTLGAVNTDPRCSIGGAHVLP